MGFITGRFAEDDSDPVLAAVRSLKFLDMDRGPWVGGGALRRIFSREPLKGGDLDVFLPNEEEKALTGLEKMKPVFSRIKPEAHHTSDLSRFIEKMLRNQDGYRRYQCQGDSSETFIFEKMKVQVILQRRYEDVYALLNDFDYTICMAATDGWRWVADDRLFDDLKNKRLILGVENPRLNMLRLTKYCSFGFMPGPGLLTKLLKLDKGDDLVSINDKGKIDDGLGY